MLLQTRYVEYDRETGEILSILNADSTSVPEQEGIGLLEVPAGFQCDTSAYIVRDERLVRIWETGDERRERERLEKTQKKTGTALINALAKRFLIAMLFRDEKEMERLRNEAIPLKVHL